MLGRVINMKYKVSSAWAGKYAKTKHGLTNSLTLAIWWQFSWSCIEFVRVLKLNKYHYGNIFGVGKKLTDCYGRVL
jgi:hypothetical protein